METKDEAIGPSGIQNEVPTALAAALRCPPLERKGWEWTIGPSYIALFLWVVAFDQLGSRTLAIGGLRWSLAGVATAAVLCYLLLYRVPALWGQRTGWPSTVLGASTFGATGTVGLMFVVFGLAQVVWLAVATFYALDWTFQGLNSLGLFPARLLNPQSLHTGGAAGRVVEIRSTVFLVSSLFWLYAATLVGNYLVRIIQALMNIYPIFPAIMLGLAMVLTVRGVGGFRPLEVDPATGLPIVNGGPRAFLMAIQMMFGFFAMAGVSAADWGAVSRTPRDVRLGGLVGVGFASWTVSALALLTVAGALGRYPVPPTVPVPAGSVDEGFTFRVALLLGLPEQLAGATLLIFGLASLAPTCYAAFLFGERFHAVVPQVSRLKWTLLGASSSWPLIASGIAGRLETIYTILGALFTPILGAMASDYAYQRGVWPGVRRGVNLAGIAAWLVGVLVGLVPLLLSSLRMGESHRFQPASFFAFVAAFLTHAVLARLGLEPPVLEVPQPVPILEPAPTAEISMADVPAVGEEPGP